MLLLQRKLQGERHLIRFRRFTGEKMDRSLSVPLGSCTTFHKENLRVNFINVIGLGAKLSTLNEIFIHFFLKFVRFMAPYDDGEFLFKKKLFGVVCSIV